MKRLLVLAVIMTGFLSVMNGQTYYNMWRGSGTSGKPEWIANLAMRTYSEATGIEFTTGNNCRGFVNGGGRWGFINPANPMAPISLSNIINGINNLTLGVQGWACAEGVSVRVLSDRVTTTLDLISANGGSSITSNGDSQGLHIRSATGNKIYLHDKVYFDQYFWTSFGPGRNNDPTIHNTHDKMFRLGSKGTVGIWGGDGVDTNDKPHLHVSAERVRATVPLKVEQNNITLFMGMAQDLKDAWVGTTTAQGMHLGTNNKTVAYFAPDDNMYVGLTDDDVKKIRQELKNKYKLFVAKGLLSEDYAIAPKSSWADFVFNENYQLPTIFEVDAYVKENKHLPDVPSAKQVAEEGYSQHDMNKVLLQKIEELTLYTIQQQKEIQELKTELNNLKK